MRRKQCWIAVILLSICLGGLWSAAVAQTADAPAAAVEEPVEQKTSLMGLLKQGGILMWPLGDLVILTMEAAEIATDGGDGIAE